MDSKYILIVGQGRSGTNWLLDILDLSAKTHCRNEADQLTTSPLAGLSMKRVQLPLDEALGQQWDQAIALASLKMGVRDRIGGTRKYHLYDIVRRFGGAYVFRKKRLRLLLSFLMPSLRQEDWPVPWWFSSPQALEQAFTVFKLNQIPAWTEWLLLNRPDTMIIHIVRHPSGFLNSWQKRYLAQQNSSEVKRTNQERLRQIAEIDANWSQLFGDIEVMTVDESELWYWRYATEKIDAAGNGRANYLRIIYEDLVSDTLKVSKQLYEKCDLPWMLEIETAISNSASSSNLIATAWRKNLLPEEISLVEHVLAGSPMSQWWRER